MRGAHGEGRAPAGVRPARRHPPRQRSRAAARGLRSHRCPAQALHPEGAAGIERLIVSEGIAIHRYDGVEWRERTRRLHVSLTRDRIRALVDLADFDFDFVNRIAEELARAGGEREAPQRIRLAPNVTAALLPSLISVMEIEQTPAPHDGKGRPIERLMLAECGPAAFGTDTAKADVQFDRPKVSTGEREPPLRCGSRVSRL